MSQRKIRRHNMPPKARKSPIVDPLLGPVPHTSPHPSGRKATPIPFPKDARSKARNRMRLTLLATTMLMFLLARFFPEDVRRFMDEHGPVGRLFLLALLIIPAVAAYRSVPKPPPAK